MIEIKPMIFKEELYKAREAAEILPKGWQFWIVEMNGNRPVPVDVYQANGDISERKRDRLITWGIDEGWLDITGDGWVACKGCLRPFIISAATWNCPHCKSYDGDHLVNCVFDLMNPPRVL